MSWNIRALGVTLILVSTLCFGQTNVVLKDIQGTSIDFAALKGKWILINYWASWCKTCIDEIPELNRFYQKHKKDPVALFAVNFDGLPLYRQKMLVQKFNILYPSLSKDPSTALGLGDIVGVPVTFVINPQGELVNTLYGGQDLKGLDEEIEQ